MSEGGGSGVEAPWALARVGGGPVEKAEEATPLIKTETETETKPSKETGPTTTGNSLNDNNAAPVLPRKVSNKTEPIAAAVAKAPAKEVVPRGAYASKVPGAPVPTALPVLAAASVIVAEENPVATDGPPSSTPASNHKDPTATAPTAVTVQSGSNCLKWKDPYLKFCHWHYS